MGVTGLWPSLTKERRGGTEQSKAAVELESLDAYLALEMQRKSGPLAVPDDAEALPIPELGLRQLTVVQGTQNVDQVGQLGSHTIVPGAVHMDIGTRRRIAARRRIDPEHVGPARELLAEIGIEA